LKKRKLNPLHVVGMEGFWGLSIMLVVVLPMLYLLHGDDHGSKENVKDAISNLHSSWQLCLYMAVYTCSIAFYNFFGLSVAKKLSTVHRTLIDALRTAVVWTVAVAIYYAGEKRYGEPLTNWSYLQGGGFVFLIVGTLCYNAVLKLPGLYYPPTDAEVESKLDALLAHDMSADADDVAGAVL
jgi:hypothetical protein